MEDLPSGFINIESIIADSSSEAENVLISYARYLQSWRVTRKNISIFFNLLALNKNSVDNILFENKEPSTFFASISPDRMMVLHTMEILSGNSPYNFSIKTVLALLGLLLSTYSHALSGMEIYPLSIPDLQHIAKFFVIENDTSQKHIIRIFESLQALPKRYVIAAYASELLNACLDPEKSIDSVISPGLLH